MKTKTHTKLEGRRLLPEARCYAPLVVLPTSTTPEQLEQIRAAGYVTVCSDDPSKVVVVLPQTRIAGDDMLMAALYGLESDGCTSPKQKFVSELYRRLNGKGA